MAEPAPAPAESLAADAGAAQAAAWARPLSHDKLALGDGDATAAQAWSGAPFSPAACVAVPRGGGAAALAVVVEELPKGGWFSFGLGRAMEKEGALFGDGDGTCGLRQHTSAESDRRAAAKGFGRRARRSR